MDALFLFLLGLVVTLSHSYRQPSAVSVLVLACVCFYSATSESIQKETPRGLRYVKLALLSVSSIAPLIAKSLKHIWSPKLKKSKEGRDWAVVALCALAIAFVDTWSLRHNKKELFLPGVVLLTTGALDLIVWFAAKSAA